MSRSVRWQGLTRAVGRAAPAIGLTLAVLVSLAVYSRYISSAERVQQAENQLAQCRKLVAEMRQLESVPTFAVLDADSQRTIARHIEQASRQAKLSEDTRSVVVRIQYYASPRRLGESPYHVFSTRIELKRVTLRQVIEFMHALSDAGKGLTVRDLRLWTARRAADTTSETWSAEVTLTQLAFSPKTR